MLLGKLHVLDSNMRECPAGQAGELWFETATPFEYFNDPDRTAQARSTDGAMSTVGDVGYVDADGFVYLTDRATFMIISGGVNIYPQECENLLATHPKVADAAVFGVPNADLGEEVKAVIQLIEGIAPQMGCPRDDRLLPGPSRPHQVSPLDPFHGRAAEAAHGQALQARAAGSLLERAGYSDSLTPGSIAIRIVGCGMLCSLPEPAPGSRARVCKAKLAYYSFTHCKKGSQSMDGGNVMPNSISCLTACAMLVLVRLRRTT